MNVVRPRNREEFVKILEEAKKSGKLVYISAYPCPECEIFEAALEELRVDVAKIVKIDVPNEDWAIDFVLRELKIPGAPTVITPDGKVLDDFDPIVLAKRVKEYVEKSRA